MVFVYVFDLFSTMPSRVIHVVANGKISFLWLSNTPLYHVLLMGGVAVNMFIFNPSQSP